MSHNYTAIIVDENNSVRKAFASVVRTNFNMRDIYVSTTAREAEAVCKQSQKIDWVFCESNLPDKDCFTLIEELKKIKSSQNAKFVLVSTKPSRELLIKASTAGISEFILKPFTPKTIVAKISKLVNGKTLRKSKRVTLLEAFDANISFNDNHYATSLVDISLGGCMVKTPVFNKGGGFIYDMASINFPLDGESLMLKAKLIRMEHDPSTEDELIFAAFVFKDLDIETAKKLDAFLSKLK